MNRVQKETFIDQLAQGVNSATALAVMSFQKLSVEQITRFRLNLAKQNVKVKVVKNTLAKKVFERSSFADLASHFQGPTLIVYSSEDPVVTAKAISEWLNKEDFAIKVKAGAALGQIVDEAKLIALSKLPSKNELLASFVWALKSPATKFLYALKDAPQRLMFALNAFKEKKENESKK